MNTCNNCNCNRGKGNENIHQFNSYYSSNQLQLLKVIFPHLNSKMQNNLAVYIKFLELKLTLENTYRYPHSCHVETMELLDELLEISTGEERHRIMNMKNTFQNLHQVQETMETIQMMQEMFPEGANIFENEELLKEMFKNGF